MRTEQPKTHQNPKAEESAASIYSIPNLSFSFSSELRTACDEMAAQAETVVRARAGIGRLAAQLAELEAKAEELRGTIDTAGGSSSARAALGLATNADDCSAEQIQSARAELINTENQIEGLRAAAKVAPNLYEAERRKLEEAIDAASTFHARDLAAISDWISIGRRIIGLFTMHVQTLEQVVISKGKFAPVPAHGVTAPPPGHPLSVIPLVAGISRQIDAARDADRPLPARSADSPLPALATLNETTPRQERQPDWKPRSKEERDRADRAQQEKFREAESARAIKITYADPPAKAG